MSRPKQILSMQKFQFENEENQDKLVTHKKEKEYISPQVRCKSGKILLTLANDSQY